MALRLMRRRLSLVLQIGTNMLFVKQSLIENIGIFIPNDIYYGPSEAA
jgi:hypothetical protein